MYSMQARNSAGRRIRRGLGLRKQDRQKLPLLLSGTTRQVRGRVAVMPKPLTTRSAMDDTPPACDLAEAANFLEYDLRDSADEQHDRAVRWRDDDPELSLL